MSTTAVFEKKGIIQWREWRVSGEASVEARGHPWLMQPQNPIQYTPFGSHDANNMRASRLELQIGKNKIQ